MGLSGFHTRAWVRTQGAFRTVVALESLTGMDDDLLQAAWMESFLQVTSTLCSNASQALVQLEEVAGVSVKV